MENYRDPLREFDEWDAEMAKKRAEWERDEARICAVCGEPTDYPFYNIWPDERDGVICVECFAHQMKLAKTLLNRCFVDAIDDKLTEFYERRF